MAFTFFNKQKKSSSSAKNRLEMLLYMERLGLSPETMEQMKIEIIDVVKKYIDIDEDNFDLKVNRDGNVNMGSLYTNIPIKEGNRR